MRTATRYPPTMVSRSPSVILNDSHTMPQLGWASGRPTTRETEEIVRFALDDAGYRSIDTATDYGNEAGVGRGLAASGVDRDDVFITTKLWNAEHGRVNTLAAVDTSLAVGPGPSRPLSDPLAARRPRGTAG